MRLQRYHPVAGSDVAASYNRYCILFIPEDKMVQLYVSNTSDGTKKKLRHEKKTNLFPLGPHVESLRCGTKNLMAMNSVNSVI